MRIREKFQLATCVTFLLFTVSTGGAIFSVFYTHELPFNSSAAAVPESLYASTSSLFVLGVAAIALGHFALLANMPPLLGTLWLQANVTKKIFLTFEHLPSFGTVGSFMTTLDHF